MSSYHVHFCPQNVPIHREDTLWNFVCWHWEMLPARMAPPSRRTLRPFQKVHGVDFTVVNGENVSGVGLTPDQAEDLFAAGADVITLGNHTWGKMQIADYLEDSPYILRPANFSPARRAVAWES